MSAAQTGRRMTPCHVCVPGGRGQLRRQLPLLLLLLQAPVRRPVVERDPPLSCAPTGYPAGPTRERQSHNQSRQNPRQCSQLAPRQGHSSVWSRVHVHSSAGRPPRHRRALALAAGGGRPAAPLVARPAQGQARRGRQNCHAADSPQQAFDRGHACGRRRQRNLVCRRLQSQLLSGRGISVHFESLSAAAGQQRGAYAPVLVPASSLCRCYAACAGTLPPARSQKSQHTNTHQYKHIPHNAWCAERRGGGWRELWSGNARRA